MMFVLLVAASTLPTRAQQPQTLREAFSAIEQYCTTVTSSQGSFASCEAEQSIAAIRLRPFFADPRPVFKELVGRCMQASTTVEGTNFVSAWSCFVAAQ
jgi:hypothetical protein